MLHSYNTLNLYKNCQFAYKLRYLENQKITIYDKKTLDGIILHSFLQQFFNQILPQKLISTIKYLKFELNNKKYYIPENYLGLTNQEIKNIFNKLNNIIKQDFFQKIINLNYKFLYPELQITNEKLIGTLDLFIKLNDEKAFIIDYKSGNSYFVNMEQLYIYAILIFENFTSLKEIMLVSYYFNDNKTIKHLFYRSEYKFYKNKLLKKIKEIDNKKVFNKNLNYCKQCFFKKICDNYTLLDILTNNIINLFNYNKNLFLGNGNYNSENIILIPNTVDIKTKKDIEILLVKNNLSPQSYLVLLTNNLFKDNKIISYHKENLKKTISKLNIKNIYCLENNSFNYITNLNLKINNIYKKNYKISFYNKSFDIKIVKNLKEI